MKCEFEEKTFENILSRELEGRSNIIYPPGQFFEGTIGIDGAVYSKNRKFWRLWTDKWYRILPLAPIHHPGVFLDAQYWDMVQSDIDDDEFPKFKFNVFIQYKRPDYMVDTRLYEYQFWNQSFFRYEITEHQQRILCTLENNLSPDALVVYACPAFYEKRDLWKYQAQNCVVENTNFVKPLSVDGHKHYTFIKSGTFGRGFSQPEKIECVNIIDQIDRLTKRETQYGSNSEFLRNLSRLLLEVIEQQERDYKTTFFSLLSNNLVDSDHELSKDIQIIYTFLFYNGLSWAIGLD